MPQPLAKKSAVDRVTPHCQSVRTGPPQSIGSLSFTQSYQTGKSENWLEQPKPTIQAIRDRTHWNISNIQPIDPVALGLCKQSELDKIVQKAAEKKAAEGGGMTMMNGANWWELSSLWTCRHSLKCRLPSKVSKPLLCVTKATRINPTRMSSWMPTAFSTCRTMINSRIIQRNNIRGSQNDLRAFKAAEMVPSSR